MPGERCARSLACDKNKAHERSHHGHTGNTRHSPRNGFNGLYRALPGDRAFLPPSPLRSLLLKSLTPASGRQDHTTSPSAGKRIRLVCCRVHRIPHPTSVTMRNAPPEGGGMGLDIHLICISEKQKYFWCGGWTANLSGLSHFN